MNEKYLLAPLLEPGLVLTRLAADILLIFQVPEVSGIVERLINFLESGDMDIVSETLVQMKDLLRRFVSNKCRFRLQFSLSPVIL